MTPTKPKPCKHNRIIYRLVVIGSQYLSEYVCCDCNSIMDVKKKE